MKETSHSLNLKQEIYEVIKESSPKEIQEKLKTYHPSDIAETFEMMDDEQLGFMLQSLNFHLLADIFEYLDSEDAAELMKRLSTQKGANVLETMEPDDAADVLQEMKEHAADQVLSAMHEENRDTLNTLSEYKEETAGAIMTTDFVILTKGMDVTEAMKVLVKSAKSTEGIQRLFVLDDKNFLEGVIELKALIQARAPKSIDEIMYSDVVSVHVDDSAEDVAKKIQNYGIYVMPVVNDKNQIQGVITMDDAADILDDATDEDYGKFAALSSDIVLNESVFKSAFHRLPWLILLLLLGLVISTIISRFETTIERVAVLVIFQPLILDMAGNTGTQSLAVTVRGISKDFFSLKGSAKRHLLKELRIGVLSGIAIGLFSMVTTFVFLTIAAPTMAIGGPIEVALTVGFSAAFALSFAAVFGAFFPLFLYKINVDPAVASGPFITTLNDVIGLVIYFSLAMLIIL